MLPSIVPKKSIYDLAIFGGSPAFHSTLHVNRPNTGDRSTFDRYIDSAWNSRWFTNDGPLVRELEDKLQNYLDVKHCILTSNGTAALAATINALNLSGEIILPSFTFISTAHTLALNKIKPVFCDIDPQSWNIDFEQCEKLISDKTTAIIPTHTFGHPCEINKLEEIVRRRGLKLIFDSAHAFGCGYNGKMIGRFGDAEIFSFHATKVFHTFEGGAITTNNDTLAYRLKKFRNFGFNDMGQIENVGTNAKMSETHAAMGLTNLKSLTKFIKQNEAGFELYDRYLNSIPGLTIHRNPIPEKHNYQYVCLDISMRDFGLSRDQLMQILHAENALVRRYFSPGCHQTTTFKSTDLQEFDRLKYTNSISQRVLVLPSGTSASEIEIVELCSLIKLIANNASLVLSQLESLENSAEQSIIVNS